MLSSLPPVVSLAVLLRFLVSLEESWTTSARLPGRLRLSRRCQPLAESAWSPANLQPVAGFAVNRLGRESTGCFGCFKGIKVHFVVQWCIFWILRNGVTPNDLNDIALSNRTLVRSSCNWQSLTNGYPHATVNQPTSKGSADLLWLPRTKDLAKVEKSSMPIPQEQFTRAKTNRTTFLDRNSSGLNKNKGHTTNRQCSRVAMPFPGRKWVCGFLVGSLSCYQIFKTIGDLLTDSDSNAEVFPMFFLVPIKQGRETPCLSGGNKCSGSPQDPAVPCRKESHTQKGQKGIGANSSKRCNIWIKMSTMYTYMSIVCVYIYMYYTYLLCVTKTIEWYCAAYQHASSNVILHQSAGQRATYSKPMENTKFLLLLSSFTPKIHLCGGMSTCLPALHLHFGSSSLQRIHKTRVFVGRTDHNPIFLIWMRKSPLDGYS